MARRVLAAVLKTAAMQTGNGRIAVFAAIAEAGNTAKITFPVRDGGSFVVQSAPGEGPPSRSPCRNARCLIWSRKTDSFRAFAAAFAGQNHSTIRPLG